MTKKITLFTLFLAFSMFASAQMIHGLRELGAPPTQEEINQNNTAAVTHYKELLKDAKDGKIKDEPDKPDRVLNIYNSYGWYQVLTADYKGAEKTLRAGMKIKAEFEFFPTNLAPALLLQGKYKDAEKIYLDYKDKNLKDQSYATVFLADLAEIKATGLAPQKYDADVEKIIALLSKK